MDFTGKIIFVGEIKQGVGQSGKAWKIQTVVIEELTGRFPQILVADIFGADKVDELAPKPGEVVTAQYYVEGRQYEGRWFGSNKIYKMLRQNPTAAPQQNVVQAPQPQTLQPAPQTQQDDLPF